MCENHAYPTTYISTDVVFQIPVNWNTCQSSVYVQSMKQQAVRIVSMHQEAFFVAVDSILGAVVGVEERAIGSIPGNEGRIVQVRVNVRGGLRVFSVYFWHSGGWTPRYEALLEAVLFESRPHKAVLFVVEREKEIREWGRRCGRCCLVVVEGGCQEEAHKRKAKKKERKTRIAEKEESGDTSRKK